MTRVLLYIFVLLVTAGVAHSQKIVPATSLVLNLDYACFRYADRMGYLELYYGFYPKLVSYEFRDAKYAGVIKVRTLLTDKQTGEAAIDHSFSLPIFTPDTSAASFNYTFITQGGYSVQLGEYVLSVLAVDSLSPDRRDSIRVPLSVTPYTGTAISDLELCSSIKESDDKSDSFFKNSMVVVPNPTLVFGVTAHPVMFAYAEIYNLDKDSAYSVKTAITDSRGKAVRETSKKRSFRVQNAVEVNTVNTTSIPSGRYQYHLMLANSDGVEIAKTSKLFYLNNPHVKTSRTTTASINASEFDALTAEELEDEFRKAQYLATDQEIKTFSQITSADGRKEFLIKFWTEVEPGRLEKNPIKRVEYLQRVNLANDRYRVLGRQGWKTDRGRVFVLYGEPDEVERHPSGQDMKPYESWNYYEIENGVQFVFVDRSGFGDYVLVHSSKRGELRDDGWQRYLR